jgi:uncharacterized protein (TIGR02246 family)
MTETSHIATDMLERYRAAVRAKDVDAFAALYDSDLRVFDAWATWSYEGQPAWRDMASGCFSSDGGTTLDVDFSEVKTRETAEMLVVSAIATYSGVGPAGEEMPRVSNRFTWVIAAEKVSWRIVHEHSSIPLVFDTRVAVAHPG